MIGALVGVGVATKKVISDTMAYDQSIRDLSAISGQSAEETSRFVQVLDDYQLTTQDAEAATRALTKNGLVPNIDTLGQLSDAYLAIQDPAERNEFIIKNLGRAGLQWVNVLKQGSAALKEQGAAISDNLIVTDAMIRKEEQFRLQVDELSDAWEGAKIKIGNDAIPVLVTALDAFDNSEKELALSLGLVGREADRFAMSLLDMKNNVDSATTSYTAWAEAIASQVTPELEDLSVATAEVSNANMGMVSLFESIQSETDSYRETQASLRNEMALLKEEYFAGNIAQDEYKTKVEQITGAMRENELAHIQASKNIAFSLLQQKLAIDGLSDTEFKALTAMGVQWGIFDQATADSAIAMDVAVANMAGNLEELTGKYKDPISRATTLNEKIEAAAAKSGMEWNYTFNIITRGSIPRLPWSDRLDADNRPGSGGQSAGGQVFGPGDGSRDTFLVPMANGEFVIRSSIVRKKGMLQFLEELNKGMFTNGFASGGLVRDRGPLTGDDLRQARIEQRMKRRDEGGGGVTLPTPTTSTSSLSETVGGGAAPAMAAGLAGGPVGQAVATAAAIQAASSVQSVKQLTSINNKLERLIAITPSEQGIARAASNMTSKYS